MLKFLICWNFSYAESISTRASGCIFCIKYSLGFSWACFISCCSTDAKPQKNFWTTPLSCNPQNDAHQGECDNTGMHMPPCSAMACICRLAVPWHAAACSSVLFLLFGWIYLLFCGGQQDPITSLAVDESRLNPNYLSKWPSLLLLWHCSSARCQWAVAVSTSFLIL